jgi:uncharacterized membrane protein
MIKSIEEFLFGKVIGRVFARLAVSGAAYIAGQLLGVGIHVDTAEVQAALITGANALYTMIKGWRDKRAAASQVQVVAVVPEAK